MAQQFDPVTTKIMLSTYDDTNTLYQKAINTVNNLTEDSNIAWKGAAGDQYRGELQNWVKGIVEVKNGLDGLSGAMTDYRNRSQQTEGDNTGTATGWNHP